MQIIIVSVNSPVGTIYVIKMFCLKFFKNYLNIIPKTVVFSIQNFKLIESVYNELIDQVMISCLNNKFVIKKNFQIGNFEVMQEVA